MKTYNKQDKSLAISLFKQYNNVGYDGSENGLHLYLKGGEFGANWQKQKDKDTIDTIDKLLNTLKEVLILGSVKGEKFTYVTSTDKIDELITLIKNIEQSK